MPAFTDEVVKPPMLKGVDFTNDARITNPGAAKELYNLYARAPGVLSVRPGSTVLASTCVAPSRIPDVTFAATGSSRVAIDRKDLSYLRDAIPAVAQHKGHNPLWNKFSVEQSSLLSTNFSTLTANTTGAAGRFVNGLARVYIPYLNRSRWVGTIHRNAPYTDFFWWFDETNGQLKAIQREAGLVISSGDDWTILPISTGKFSVSNHNELLKGCVALATNGSGKVLGIFDRSNTYSSDPFEIRAMLIRTAAYSDYDVVNVQHMCMYGGQLCLGGFDLFKTASTLKSFANCIVFVDIDPADGSMLIESIGGTESLSLADTTVGSPDKLYYIKIGDHLSERVRAVAPVSSITDSQGIKGGLAVFTDKRVAIYQNPPPTGDNANGSDFHVVALGEVGSTAVKSIARTPHGLIFLGNDGLFYLIGLSNIISPMSRAIAPEFANLSPRAYRKVCGYYDGSFYKVFYPQRSRTKMQGNIVMPNAGKEVFETPSHNTLHMYADFRYLSPRQQDLGVLWYGTHDGLNVSCVVRATDMEDYGFVAAGCSHTVALLQLDRYDLRTDPLMSNFASTRRAPWRLVSGDYDDRDIHVEKDATALRFAIRTNENITVNAGIAAFGDVTNVSKCYQKDLDLVPTGSAGDPGPLADGTEPFQSEQETRRAARYRP